MKNKSIGFIVIVLLVWFFSKDNKAPSYPAAKPAQESGMYEQAKIVYVNANTLKVLSTPNGSPLESLQRGAQVKVYEQRNDWSRISAANEKERWVSSSYLCESTNCYVKKVTPPSPEKLRT
ncbi:TPA: SH3 domain-containing protein [Raoultella planticola]